MLGWFLLNYFDPRFKFRICFFVRSLLSHTQTQMKTAALNEKYVRFLFRWLNVFVDFCARAQAGYRAITAQNNNIQSNFSVLQHQHCIHCRQQHMWRQPTTRQNDWIWRSAFTCHSNDNLCPHHTGKCSTRFSIPLKFK